MPTKCEHCGTMEFEPEHEGTLSKTGTRMFAVPEDVLAGLFDLDARAEELASRALGRCAHIIKKRTGLDISEALLLAFDRQSKVK